MMNTNFNLLMAFDVNYFIGKAVEGVSYIRPWMTNSSQQEVLTIKPEPKLCCNR